MHIGEFRGTLYTGNSESRKMVSVQDIATPTATTTAGLTPGDEDTVRVDGQGVDDGLVAREVLHEVAVGELPDLDVVRRGGGETEPKNVRNGTLKVKPKYIFCITVN